MRRTGERTHQEIDTTEDEGPRVGLGPVDEEAGNRRAEDGSNSLPQQQKAEGVGELLEAEQVDEDDTRETDVRGDGEAEDTRVDTESFEVGGQEGERRQDATQLKETYGRGGERALTERDRL